MDMLVVLVDVSSLCSLSQLVYSDHTHILSGKKRVWFLCDDDDKH